MKKIRISHRGDAGEHAAPVPEPLGKEAGDGDGADLGRVPAQALGHDEPVEVGADGQADGRSSPPRPRRTGRPGRADP